MRSQEEITLIAANWLSRRYGDSLKVEFSDVGDPDVADRHAAVLRAVEERHWGLPALTIDGELVQLEWFSAWALADAVEAWLEARRASVRGASR